MHPTKIKFIALSSISLILTSCGGSVGSDPNASSISLTASSPTISYGQTVNINWIGHNIQNIDSSNFQAGSNALTGSITDKPAITTTYTITARGNDSQLYTSTVTVNLVKGNKKILFVGDVAQSGVNQIIEFIQGMTTQTVQVSPTLPSSFTADVVVLSRSASVSPSDVSAVQAQLTAGKGVVVISVAAQLLATGNINNSDVSAIGSFLAGVTDSTNNDSLNSSLVTTSPIGLPFGATILGEEINGDSLSPISANAILTTQNSPWQSGGHSGFCYSPASGGRIAYAGQAPIDNSKVGIATRTMLLSEIRWASGE